MLVVLAARTPDPGGADPLSRHLAALVIGLEQRLGRVRLVVAEQDPGPAARLSAHGVHAEHAADPVGWARRHGGTARAVVLTSLTPPLDLAVIELARRTDAPIVAVLGSLASAEHGVSAQRPDRSHVAGVEHVTEHLAAREAAALEVCSDIVCIHDPVAHAVAELVGAEQRPPPRVVRPAPLREPLHPALRHSQRRGALAPLQLYSEIGLPDEEGLRALFEASAGDESQRWLQFRPDQFTVLGLDGPSRLQPPLVSQVRTPDPHTLTDEIAAAHVALLPRRFGMATPLLAEDLAAGGLPAVAHADTFGSSDLLAELGLLANDDSDASALWETARSLIDDAAAWDAAGERLASWREGARRRPSLSDAVSEVLHERRVVGLTGARAATSGSTTPLAPVERLPGTGWVGSAAAVRPAQERFERRLGTGWGVERDPGLHVQFIVGGDRPYKLWRNIHEEDDTALARLRAEASQLPTRPTISVLVPTFNTPEGLLREAVDSVLAQAYPYWQLCIADDASTDGTTAALVAELCELDDRIDGVVLDEGRGIAGATAAAFALARGEYVALLDHDDLLHPAALWWVARLLGDDPDLDVVYTDEDKLDEHGNRCDPLFKPDWDPDLLLGCNYLNHLSVLRRSLVSQVGGWRSDFDGSQDHDLLLRATELTDRVGHVARPLYHWRAVVGSEAAQAGVKPTTADAGRRAVTEALARRDIDARVTEGVLPTWHRVQHRHGDDPLVSVVIPTRNRHELLRDCLESLHRSVAHPHVEVVVVDNESDDPATLAYLADAPVTVVRYPHPFNYARQMNLGVAAATGSLVLLLNNDTRADEPGWFEALLEQALRPGVGAVGLRLLRLGPSGAHTDDDETDDDPGVKVQHEGIVLGVGGQALNLTCGPHGVYGANVRSSAAVTAAAMLCRTSAFWAVGGFDEQIPVAFNDVDFCLRLGAIGLRTVYTPWGELYHAESASRGALHPPEDEDYYAQRWGEVATKRDHCYNAHLDLLDPFVLRL